MRIHKTPGPIINLTVLHSIEDHERYNKGLVSLERTSLRLYNLLAFGYFP
jgi:hypothetical protein